MPLLAVIGAIAAAWIGLVAFVLLFVAIAKKPTPPVPTEDDQ